MFGWLLAFGWFARVFGFWVPGLLAGRPVLGKPCPFGRVFLGQLRQLGRVCLFSLGSGALVARASVFVFRASVDCLGGRWLRVVLLGCLALGDRDVVLGEACCTWGRWRAQFFGVIGCLGGRRRRRVARAGCPGLGQSLLLGSGLGSSPNRSIHQV